MEQNEIIEGNKLIAEFMQWKHHEDIEYDNYEMSNLKYHSSWDWIMPVVEKIESVYYAVNINQKWVNVIDNNLTIDEDFNTHGMDTIFTEHENKIIAIWLAVIEFIKWYTNQNTK